MLDRYRLWWYSVVILITASMKTSETIAKISPALLNAQKKIKSVTKEADNPYFKSKYADLASVINACKEELNSEGITVLQPVDEMFVETLLLHTSGEFMSARTPIVCKSSNNPQDLGSAITYARRYGLQSMVFLPAVDDDGEAATSHSDTPKTAPTSSDDQLCPVHNINVPKRLSKSTGKAYWLCNGDPKKTHFLDDPNKSMGDQDIF